MVRRRFGSRAVLALAIAGSVIACRQLVGIHDEPIGPSGDAGAGLDSNVGADAASCTPPANADVCHTCLAGSCCSQFAACNAETSCKHSLDCILGCGATDESCRAACVEGFDTALADVLACRARACAVPCDTSCGGVVGELFPDIVAASVTCAACVTDKVCNELTACATDSSCLRFTACPTRNCAYGDRACQTACRFPVGLAGSKPSNALFNAIHSRCTSECRQGTDWDCVGKVSSPIGQSGAITFDATFLDAVTRKPFVGAQVRTCAFLGPDCVTALGTGFTDATGHVRVAAQIIGGMQFNGYVEITGANAFPTLLFNFPLIAGSLVGDATYSIELDVFSTLDVSLVTMAVPITIDMTSHGTMNAVVQDCLRTSGSGLVFDVSPSDSTTVVGYQRNGQYDPTATATDTTGSAFAANIPPGNVTISARLASTNELVSRATVLVRAGTNTAVSMASLPMP